MIYDRRRKVREMHLENHIRTVITVLKNGGTVIYPTETVYGLGADALPEGAIREVHN